MELSKRCPTCGAENKPSEMMCGRCFGDISGIAPAPPQEQAAPAEPRRDATPGTLLLRLPSQAVITVGDGDAVGRSAVGRELLAPHGKVSRQHVRFERTADGWTVRDLASANGTYLDGVRIPEGTATRLATGSRIGLSSSLELVVEAKEGGP